MKKNKETSTILSSNSFPVVGIGASAGGLDAFKKLLRAIPDNSGIAYVLVQHLDPSHESLLPDLLQKVTNIPVLEITDDIKVQPDHIYIIPSNKMLLANDGILQLSPRPVKDKNQRNLPIDLFFTSLAEVHQNYALGVVLSGTASDGTQGLKAIKDHGGITFAQDEESAAFDGMPHSARMAGVVDFVLPPEKIPAKLLEIINGVYKSDEELQTVPQQDEAAFKQILSLLRIRKGTDFTYYKQTTIRRRILRRMALNKNEEPSVYLNHLRGDKTEQDALYQDLLIPVTSFFRDPKVFDNLCESVFPHIIKNKAPGEPIRVWVAGCSTGEEAYSLAICLKEFLGDTQEKVQIFATDISEPAVAKARTGIYTKSELEAVTPIRLQEFFNKTQGGYQVNQEVRDMCVFAVHNFLKDPPFGKVDFLSCRNVLIYMEPYLQKKALTTFHYALKPKGLLLLGKSETSSSVPDLFASVTKHDKLFNRKDVPGRFMHVTSGHSEQSLRVLDNDPKGSNVLTDFQKTADDIMLSRYTPAGVVVNEVMDIVHFRGATADYLEQAPGKPSHNLLKMAKGGLAFELRNILHKAKKENTGIVKENIQVIINSTPRMIAIEAMPLPHIIEPHYLILFHDNAPVAKSRRTASATIEVPKSKKAETLRIQQLEKELVQIREDMRSITEDQEAVNEELQSANEELLSSSEELQSLNEELETSKEELQTTNEELTVLNQELVGLNQHITDARDYAEAIISTVRTPLLVLDKNLRIVTANNSFYKTFRTTEPETEGKLIYELGNKQWNIPALQKLLEEILPHETKFADFEVSYTFPEIGERSMLLDARQITRQNTTEKLILLAIEDITEARLLQQKEKDFQTQLEEKIRQRTQELNMANEELQLKNQQVALSIYNKRFLTEFSERFSTYHPHLDFFNSLVLYIADLTKMDYVFVGKLVLVNQEDYVVETIAITAFNKLADNITYPLKDGPSTEVVRGVLYSYPDKCQITFPKKQMLNQFNVEGYIGYPLYDPKGNSIGLIAVMHQKEIEDAETISSILKIVAKRAEIELERIKFEDQLVAHNKILEEKNDELLNLNKELKSFTYISSHDLQEPLRKIQTFANRILGKEFGILSDKGKHDFYRIQDAASRMQTLIEDLLAYSRMDISERKYEAISLTEIVEDTIKELAENIQEKKAIIKVGELCIANINPFQFRQVMNNLLGNALKFSRPGVPPHIVIQSTSGDGLQFQNENPDLVPGKLSPKKKYCHISVTDNGIGFDPEYKELIFEVFQRLYGKDEYPGTGIGLAIVKKIITNHNGVITAFGKPDKGATFDIYIPH